MMSEYWSSLANRCNILFRLGTVDSQILILSATAGNVFSDNLYLFMWIWCWGYLNIIYLILLQIIWLRLSMSATLPVLQRTLLQVFSMTLFENSEVTALSVMLSRLHSLSAHPLVPLLPGCLVCPTFAYSDLTSGRLVVHVTVFLIGLGAPCGKCLCVIYFHILFSFICPFKYNIYQPPKSQTLRTQC